MAELEPLLEEDSNPSKPLITKVYEATFVKFDGERMFKFYRAERLIEAAEKANSVVENDPFTVLAQVRELGPID